MIAFGGGVPLRLLQAPAPKTASGTISGPATAGTRADVSSCDLPRTLLPLRTRNAVSLRSSQAVDDCEQ